MSTLTCATCGTESAAEKKFCAECGAALPLPCPSCGHPVTATQKFCTECGAPLPVAAPTQRTPAEPPAGSTPSPTQAAVAGRTVASAVPGAPPLEERRLVTALFCDLVGFTPLSEQLDPEDTREVQTAYFSAMGQQIERYGGIVEKYAGDAVLALFGVPVAHEDDAERAVLCALGMQQAIQPVRAAVRRRHGVEIAIRVGINTGETVSGSWDASGQQQAAVTGDAVNTAARMQAAAEPSGVLVGEETMRLTRRRIQYGPEQPLTLKGKHQSVSAYAVLGIRDRMRERWDSEGAGGYATPMVGREGELQTLLNAWTQADGGAGQLLTVIGEPGVGKSRLVAEGVERIAATHHPHILRGRCLSYGQSVSLWLIADLIRSLCSVPEDARPEVVQQHIAGTLDSLLASCHEADRAIARDVLGEVLGLPPADSLVAAAGPQVRRSSLVRILGLVLGALSERKQLLIILEDLHWLDTASADVLDAALSGVPSRPILVLATQRPGWTPPWSGWSWTERLTLHPLPQREAAALAGAVLGGMRLSPQLEEHLRERAEGNPFFVEELVRYLQETGKLEQRQGEVALLPGVAERLPATLTEVLLARLDRLDGQVKGVAQVGSVIGRSFAVRLLSSVMEREEAILDTPLRALQQAEIAFPRGGGAPEYVFKHVTVRDVAYGMLVRRRQRQLHLDVGRAIVQLYPSDEYTELIAYHYARTEEDAEAAEWLERAGDRADATYANEAAIQHYRGALERLGRVGADERKQAGIEEKLGEVLFRVNRYEEAQAVLERAGQKYQEAGQIEGMGRATALLGRVLWWRGELEEARRRLEAMAALLTGLRPSAASVQVQVYLASVFQYLGLYPAMLEAAERAVELAGAVGDDRLRGRAEERRGAALILLGRIEESAESLIGAVRLAEGAGDLDKLAVSLANLGVSQMRAGVLLDAVHYTERALELAVRMGFVQREITQHIGLGSQFVVTGDWARAREHLARAEELAAGRENAAIIAPYLRATLGALSLREGHWEESSQQFHRAADLAAGVDAESLEVAEASLGELAILEGRAGEAQIRLRRLVEQEGANLHLLLPTLAWAYLELGETVRGLELVQKGEREAREQQALSYLPEALRIKGMALARVGRSEEARTALTEGRERAAAMPNPYFEARILVELGQLARQEEQEKPAREHLEEAHAMFLRLGASKDVERTGEELSVLDRSAGLAG